MKILILRLIRISLRLFTRRRQFPENVSLHEHTPLKQRFKKYRELGIEGASHGIALTSIYALQNKNVLQMLTNVEVKFGTPAEAQSPTATCGWGIEREREADDRVAIRRNGVTIRVLPDPVIC